MKQFIKQIIIFVIVFSCILLFTPVIGYCQVDVEPQTFPFLIFIPLFLGTIFHWLKGYTRGSINGSIFNYFVDNIKLTITGLVLSVGQLFTFYATNPGIIANNDFAAWWLVFLMGYAGDSIGNGEGKFIKN